MIGSRLIKSNDVAAACEDIVDNYDPFSGNGLALYQLNGNADDSSPNAYNGVDSNVTWGGPGVFGTSAAFNGTSSVITLPSGSPFNDSDTIKTISAWVKLDTPTSRIRGIYSFGSGDLDFFEFRYIADGNYISVFVRNGSSANQISYQADLPSPQDTNWHHALTTFDGTNVKIYFDGQDIPITITKTGTATNSSWISYPSYSGTPVGTIGKARLASYSDGKIDQVRFFDTALDPLEVEALYTEELCICDGTVDTLDILGDGSCIATYPLDGNANDLSGQYSGDDIDVSYGVGEFDLAGVFNNSSSKIDIPLISPTSISLWIYLNSITLNAIFGNSTNTGNFIYLRDNGTIEIDNNGDFLPSTTLQAGVWQHLVFSENNGTITIYINGQPVGNYSATLGDYNVLGARTSGTPQWLDGQLDQVRIFNKALTPENVQTLAEETSCAKAACTGTTHTLNILGGGDTSCIAAYPLDGSPADLSGNYNGVQTDVTYPQGYFDLAGSFNGISSLINTYLTLDTNTVNGGSISLWFKTSNTKSTQVILGSKTSQNGASYGSVIFIGATTSTYTDESISCWDYNGATTSTFLARGGSNTYQDGAWHHLVVTSSSSAKNIYIDGNSQTIFYTASGSASSNFKLTDIQLAASLGRPESNYFDGQIDQVRIFNKALNQTEVDILFNDETPCN